MRNIYALWFDDGIFMRSIVWLTGALCSPLRLPLGVLLTLFKSPQRMKMIQCKPKKPDLIILGIFIGIFTVIYLFLWTAAAILGEDLRKIHWTIGLTANILGYAAFFLPGYYILKYVKGCVGRPLQERLTYLRVR